MPWRSDRRIYLNGDKSTVVPEAQGKFLLVGRGGTISDALCRRYHVGPYADPCPVELQDGGTAPPGVQTDLEPTEDGEGPEIESQDDLQPRRRR